VLLRLGFSHSCISGGCGLGCDALRVVSSCVVCGDFRGVVVEEVTFVPFNVGFFWCGDFCSGGLFLVVGALDKYHQDQGKYDVSMSSCAFDCRCFASIA